MARSKEVLSFNWVILSAAAAGLIQERGKSVADVENSRSVGSGHRKTRRIIKVLRRTRKNSLIWLGPCRYNILRSLLFRFSVSR